MPRINLLPWRDQQRRERKLAFFIALGGAVAVAAVAAFIAYLLLGSMIDAQEHRNERLRAQIKVLDKQIEEINDLEAQKQKYISRMQIIEKLQRSRPEVVHLFDELVKTVPEGIYLTQIKETGKKLEMKGVAQSSTRVSTFMRNIDSSSWMDNPQLQVVETAKDSPTGGSSFTLTSDVVGVDVDNGGETTVKKVAVK